MNKQFEPDPTYIRIFRFTHSKRFIEVSIAHFMKLNDHDQTPLLLKRVRSYHPAVCFVKDIHGGVGRLNDNMTSLFHLFEKVIKRHCATASPDIISMRNDQFVITYEISTKKIPPRILKLWEVRKQALIDLTKKKKGEGIF